MMFNKFLTALSL